MPKNDNDSMEMDHQSTFDLYPTCRQKWDEESNLSCSAAISWSGAKSNEPIIRNVRFAEDDKSSKSVCRTMVFYEPWTQSEISAAWYTHEDYEEFKVQCRRDTVAAFKSEYHKHFMRLYIGCGNESLASMEKEVPITKSSVRSAICVAESEFRGIEQHLYYGTMKRDRQDCVQSILDLQHDCCDIIVTNVDDDDDELAAKLAALSLQNSRRTQRISFLLGFGDSIVAQSG